MRERIIGYWTLSWIGLISNIVALPIIALIISFGPPLKVANITGSIVILGSILLTCLIYIFGRSLI